MQWWFIVQTADEVFHLGDELKKYSKSSMREKVQKNHKMNEAKREKKKERADWNMTQKDTYCLPLLGSPLPLFYTLVSGCPKVNVLKWWWCEDSHRWSHKTCTNCLPYSTFQSDFYQSFTGPQRFLVVTTNRKIEYSMISFYWLWKQIQKEANLI